MIKNNLFGQVLIGAIVFFLLLSSIQMFGWGAGIKTVEVGEESSTQIPSVPKTVNDKDEITLEDVKLLKEKINNRPMFSLNRLPFVGELPEASTNVVEENPVGALKATLMGVVITPQQSYAMILDTLTNQSETYKVGMPLEGEQGGWTLDSIQSRKVVFVSDDDKTEELELAVFSGGASAANAGGKNNPQLVNTKTNEKSKQQSNKDKKKNADDIRKKIAERRAKMRADAAKKQ